MVSKFRFKMKKILAAPGDDPNENYTYDTSVFHSIVLFVSTACLNNVPSMLSYVSSGSKLPGFLHLI